MLMINQLLTFTKASDCNVQQVCADDGNILPHTLLVRAGAIHKSKLSKKKTKKNSDKLRVFLPGCAGERRSDHPAGNIR